MHIAIEVGSCHMNKKDYIQELVEKAIEYGCDSIKFQLFPDTYEFTKTGNIALNRDLFEDAIKFAGKNIMVTASAFDEDSFQYLLGLDPPYIKFAFSKRKQVDWMKQCHEKDIPMVVTATIWDEYDFPVTKLVTAYQGEAHQTALYPNPYIMDFSSLFPEFFQGYSDHSIGWHNAFLAKQIGALFLERHMMLPNKKDIRCPDAMFASTDWSKLSHFK